MIKKISITFIISLSILFVMGVVLTLLGYFIYGEGIKGSFYVIILTIGNLFLPCLFCVVIYQFALLTAKNKFGLNNIITQIFFATILFTAITIIVLLIEPFLDQSFGEALYPRIREAVPALVALSIAIPIANSIWIKRFSKAIEKDESQT